MIEALTREPQLAQRAAKHIADRILASTVAGTRLPSVRQLAAMLGVSVPTVRAAQALLAQEGRLAIRHGSGTFASERRHGRQIGILSELNLLDHGIGRFYPAVATALTSALEARGADARLYLGTALGAAEESSDSSCPSFWADAASGRLDGGVVLTSKPTSAWERRRIDCPIPLVGDKTGHQVQPHTDGIVAAAVRRLAARGCRRLGLLSWHVVESFQQAVDACGLRTRDAWIRSDLNPTVRGSGWEEFREVWLASDEKPDGMVILDDMLFHDAQMAVFELGIRVPQDLQLAVETNRDASPPIRLPIDAIEIDPAEMAGMLAELLLRRLSGDTGIPSSQFLSFREVPMRDDEDADEMAVPAVRETFRDLVLAGQTP